MRGMKTTPRSGQDGSSQERSPYYTCPKYASVAEKMEEELSRRLAAVEEKEVARTKHVQELSLQLRQAEEAALQEKAEFQRKDLERQQALQRKEEAMKAKVSALAEALRQQEAIEAVQRKRVAALQQKQEREKREFQKRAEQQRRQQAEELRRRDAEREEATRRLEAEREAAEREARERHERELGQLRQEVARRKKKNKCSIM